MTNGIFYIISAPSGTGKSSLINSLIKKNTLFYNIKKVISYTTRNIRPGEIHGKHYYFVSLKKFKKMINQDIFFEYAKIFDNYYGTSRKTVELMLKKEIDIICNIDWQGAKNIQKKIKNTNSIFLLPPSKIELERRLRKRKQDNEQIIKKRMEQAIHDMHHFNEYDYLIINDNFNTALQNLHTIILANQLRSTRQKYYNKKLINNILSN